eukprot:gnl/Spiro4/25618_TR12759_c0_g1_i3.p1 gnl/Spiro4/25618_TR12759_c0_g1~~gnl/Spiro4/25618_TR12759_c0_g1_i3.p1  ORF type:complete len:561 (-),score=166.77 gnl/Spiro4/25618_TR12759_c0_g1_i3:20-1702(-)
MRAFFSLLWLSLLVLSSVALHLGRELAKEAIANNKAEKVSACRMLDDKGKILPASAFACPGFHKSCTAENLKAGLELYTYIRLEALEKAKKRAGAHGPGLRVVVSGGGPVGLWRAIDAWLAGATHVTVLEQRTHAPSRNQFIGFPGEYYRNSVWASIMGTGFVPKLQEADSSAVARLCSMENAMRTVIANIALRLKGAIELVVGARTEDVECDWSSSDAGCRVISESLADVNGNTKTRADEFDILIIAEGQDSKTRDLFLSSSGARSSLLWPPFVDALKTKREDWSEVAMVKLHQESQRKHVFESVSLLLDLSAHPNRICPCVSDNYYARSPHHTGLCYYALKLHDTFDGFVDGTHKNGSEQLFNKLIAMINSRLLCSKDHFSYTTDALPWEDVTWDDVYRDPLRGVPQVLLFAHPMEFLNLPLLALGPARKPETEEEIDSDKVKERLAKKKGGKKEDENEDSDEEEEEEAEGEERARAVVFVAGDAAWSPFYLAGTTFSTNLNLWKKSHLARVLAAGVLPTARGLAQSASSLANMTAQIANDRAHEVLLAAKRDYSEGL